MKYSWTHTIIIIVMACIAGFTHAENLVQNGDFRQTELADDIFDGVDKDGNLRVNTEDLPIMIEGSSQSTVYFGASPCWKDLTGDNRPDLVVGDGCGFLWIFEVKSRKGQFPPTFTHGRFIHTFLGQAINIDVADFNADNMNDVLAGTAGGAIQILRNKGDATFLDGEYKPNYQDVDQKRLRDRQIVDLSTSFPLIMKGDRPLFIGSFLTPRLVDWNGDGKNDLVVGEGSYSANSVYFFKNDGQNSNPDFSSAKKHWIAYGMGREHLAPALGDLDADGDLDLIVGERTGELTLYVNDQSGRGTDTPYITNTNTVKILVGGQTKPVGDFVKPYLADVDGDRDLDLLLGANDGRIFVSRNAGRLKFEKAVPLKGEDYFKPRKVPTPKWNHFPPCPWGWEVRYGNSGATHEVRDEIDVESGTEHRFVRVFLRDGYFGRSSSFEYPGLKLEFGQQYNLRFKYRGSQVSARTGIGRHAESQVEGDTRVYKWGSGVDFELPASSAWRQFNKTFSLAKAAQRGQESYVNCWLFFHLNKAASAGYLDIADVVIEKAGY